MIGRKNKGAKSQKDLVMEFFEKHPNKDIAHPIVVDWVTKHWRRQTGEVFRDPDRAIRTLHEEGKLIKVKKGVYHYNPKIAQSKKQENFTVVQKKKILERDENKCVICGKGKRDGVELHIDHIRPRSVGGGATISNGQTLCSQHNFIKKNLNQTETGKKMFIRLHELAKKDKDKALQKFCADILKTYKKHNINGHIEWEK